MRVPRKWNEKRNHLLFAAIVLGTLATLISGPGCTRQTDLGFETPYQVVFLDNGQMFIGKLYQSGSAFPLLRDVFYIQSLTEGDKKEVKNVLVKRGVEWHKPDFMYLNSQHILMIEPVAPDSRMALLIQETKAGKSPETPETKK